MLDRLDNLRDEHGHVLDGLIMDVLQALSRYLYSVNLISNSSKNDFTARQGFFT